ncbi:sugar-binding transcriptional regulator [Algihabitans albus]|uniref:sugar-binding transcriptional regulator n=1 Tax=Algihabitans albus TaxID=2164067 RepID=UPI001ABC648C|nr:sugar-binding transcriptional regulator [Algihabitans albus]
MVMREEGSLRKAARTAREPVEDSDLAARAAWLHYAGGMTQSAIAARFGIPTTRAHRMIARAAKDGLVRVFVDAEVSTCISLETTLTQRYGLANCTVVPDLGETGPIPLRALGLAGASFLMGLLERRDHEVIGVGHGRTMASMVDMMPLYEAGGARFVSILGGLTRKFAANPYDVIHRLAEKTGAEAYLMPAPMFVNTPEDRNIMLAQAGLVEIMKTIEAATVCILGIGAVDMSGSVAHANVFDSETSLRELRRQGACAEVLGQFLDSDGRSISTPYDGRVMAPDLETLRGREVYAVAGGAQKVAALNAALASGLFTGLITDEATADRLVRDSGKDDRKKRKKTAGANDP